MNIEEPFNVAREQGHLDLVTLEIDHYLEQLPSRLKNVDYSGQRAQYESIARKYVDARPKPFFGVFAIESDSENEPELVRVGQHTIHSETKDALVHQWESKEAKRYFQLEREDGSVYHAAVEIADGRVISVTDTNADRAFMRRQRILQAKGERLQNIVEVIRPEQDDIVRLDRQGGLVIQGGPGTGKTVVALQRLAYLLYQEYKGIPASKPVLVVGPTSSYINYIRDLLPSLGHRNVVNLDIHSLCLRRLSDSDRLQFANIREERRSITISKNTSQMVRLMRGLIWKPGTPKTISAVVSSNRRPPTTRFVTSEFISGQLASLTSRFNEDKISYNEARRELHQAIVRQLLSDQPVNEKAPAGRTLEARRDVLLENWLLKIGLHSQIERQRWRQILDTPAGGRYKRGLAAVMADYYISDIEVGIEAVAEKATLDSKILRDALDALGAPQKRGAIDEISVETEVPNEEAIDLQEIDSSTSATALANGRLAALDKVINALLPTKSVLRISESICSGDSKLFSEVLGSQGAELSRRFKNEAIKHPETNNYWWTSADLPIIAEISFLIDGNSSSDEFFHVVVDEAQDLTMMQVKAVSRYISNGNITAAGDVNQATRPSSIGDWEKFFAELDVDDWDIRTLEHNYRVPENIYDYALTYLEEDDRIETPSCDLDGGDVVLIEVEQPSIESQIHELISRIPVKGERVAVISDTPELYEAMIGSQYENTTSLTAEDCKGLEVDHSIVVLPSRWFGATAQMKRLMYVVMTRATKSVTILQNEPEKYGVLRPQVEE